MAQIAFNRAAGNAYNVSAVNGCNDNLPGSSSLRKEIQAYL